MNACPFVNREGLIYVLLTLILPFILLGHSSAQESAKVKNVQKTKGVGYKLSIKDHRISLKSKEASLKMILEEIGQEMNVEMVLRIPEEDKVTLQFNDQTLEDTLKLFKVNYAMITDSEDKGGNIKRIVVVPVGQQAKIAMTTSGNSYKEKKSRLNRDVRTKNEPFKFEFDPSKNID